MSDPETPEQKVKRARKEAQDACPCTKASVCVDVGGYFLACVCEGTGSDYVCRWSGHAAIDALVLVARQAGRVKVLEEAVIAAKGESGLACGAEVVRIERLLDAARKAGEERDGTDDPTAR